MDGDCCLLMLKGIGVDAGELLTYHMVRGGEEDEDETDHCFKCLIRHHLSICVTFGITMCV